MAYIACTILRNILSGIIVFAVLAAPAIAGADSVTFTSVRLTEGHLTFSVLVASGPDFSISAAAGPFSIVPFCDPCTPGSSFDTRTHVDFGVFGMVTYKGVSEIVNDAGIAGQAAASWEASAGSILLPPIGDSATVSAPFQMVGEVRFANCPTCFPAVNGTYIDLTGAGVASFSFLRRGSAWHLNSEIYEIMTPEPGTGLLVVTAAGGLALLWWRRARRGAFLPPVTPGA